jgi:hypothetical protein
LALNRGKDWIAHTLARIHARVRMHEIMSSRRAAANIQLRELALALHSPKKGADAGIPF